MIQSIEINNFQSHKKSVLEFSPGVNVILGTTDSGKSAILRALRKVVWNRPLGDAFCSHWGGETSIKVNLTEGASVVWRKGSKDAYIVNDGEEMKAFGTSVPDEVQAQMNITEINLQRQMDRPYLLSNTPGEVATHFNKIANIEQIGRSLAYIDREIKNANSTIKFNKNQKKEIQDKISKFDFIERAEIEIEVLEQMVVDIQNKQNSLSSLKSKINTITKIEEKTKVYLPYTSIEGQVDGLLEIKQQIFKKNKEIIELYALTKDIGYKIKEIQKYTNIISLEETVDSLLLTQDKIDKLETDLTKIKTLTKSITNKGQQIETKKEQLQRIEKRFHELMPDVCPLCENKI